MTRSSFDRFMTFWKEAHAVKRKFTVEAREGEIAVKKLQMQRRAIKGLLYQVMYGTR